MFASAIDYVRDYIRVRAICLNVSAGDRILPKLKRKILQFSKLRVLLSSEKTAPTQYIWRLLLIHSVNGKWVRASVD